jgi:hypothetical protein
MTTMLPKRTTRREVSLCQGRAKLTAETVQAIKAATGLQREIGARFGVSQPTVSKIKLGYKWRHLPAADAVAANGRMDREALPDSKIREPLWNDGVTV